MEVSPPIAPPQPLLASFDRLASAGPAAPLVLSPSRTASRHDIATMAADLAGRVGSAGVEPGLAVGFAAPNGPSFLAGLVALWRRELVPVLLDAALSPVERELTCRQLRVSAIVATAAPWPRGADDWSLGLLPGGERPPRGTVLVRTTSGSTGGPRGIALAAGALQSDDDGIAAATGLDEHDVIAAAVPMSHSYGLSVIAIPALLRGNPIVVPEEIGPLAVLDAALGCGATVFPTVPAWLASYVRLDAPWPASIRRVMSAGVRLQPEIAAAFREKTGRPVQVLYGASECGSICFDREGSAAERGTVGTLLPGVTVTLQDETSGAGTVTVRSGSVALGYWPEPGDALGDGEYRSSDLATWRDGELELRGRADAWMNVRGKKVHPSEIEQVLRQMPGCREAIVLAQPAGRAGGDRIRAVIACDTRATTASDVLTWCRGRLASHKVPRSIVLVEDFPRDARGKTARSELLTLAPAGDSAS